MEDFLLELDGGQIKITQEDEALRFEAGALHLGKPKITTITFLLDNDDKNKLGEWLTNVKLQKEDAATD